MSDRNRQQRNKFLLIMSGFMVGLCLAVGACSLAVHAEGTESSKLQNGSFEEGGPWNSTYQQPDQGSVPSWNTTAKGGKIELFRQNTGTYIAGVTLKPKEGEIAAELNADEESTLYQNVATTPSSVYTWGLDHGARNATDTMALVIGPKQSVNPSKPDRDGRDQLMQMVDWLIAQGKTSVKDSTNAGLGEQLTVYSKKFAENGTFQDNAGNNAFSLTPSSVYTEEWKIWIMADSRATSGENPWGSYGTNAEGNAGSTGSSGNTTIDTSKYYLYTVPAGQTETLFGFVSVGCVDAGGSETSNKTLGNFLDNINFQLYHPLSGSTTLHGSGVVGGSDGSSGGVGTAGSGYEVTVGHRLITYAVAGEPLKVQAVVKAADATAGCEFVGLYYTKQNTGNPVTVFLQRAGNEINDTGSLTEAEKRGKWIKSTNSVGDIIYTYYLDNLSSATDLQFVFIKSPTVTYDPNGGLSYQIDRVTYPYNTGEFQNVYSYKPVVDGENYTFIPPYVSHAAEGQNDGWKFMGWLLTGDTVSAPAGTELIHAEQLGSLLLPAEHTISCNYSVNAADQHFKIWNGNPALTAMTGGEPNPSVKWVADETAETAYANVHKGLTLVAQWRWKQAFVPQVRTDESYTDSESGGTVEITSVTDTSNPNYEVADNGTGKKSYYATTNETIKATATANTGFQFEGWYDERGNLLTTQSVYSYTETKESVNTFYARFSVIVTQTYKRQIKEEGIWKDITDDNIGVLDRYTYSDAVGKPISSRATAGTGYRFVGWYDASGNKITGDMISTDGLTLSYTTTGNATYYARFSSNTVTQTYIRQVGSGNSWSDTTDNAIGRLDLYTHSDTVGTSVSSKATAGTGYKFVGWYDASKNKITGGIVSTDGATLSYTTTGNDIYYARFSKLVTQKFIRQVKNGDSWVATTDDTIATLDCYLHTDALGETADSTATAGAGYQFEGWYDTTGNKITVDRLSNNGRTLRYTTTGNTTYYARFSKSPVNETYNRTLKKAGEIFQLSAIIPPEYMAGKNLTWTSSNPDIASVDDNGKVTAVANGTCTITVTAQDGSYTATCSITVEITGNADDANNDADDNTDDDSDSNQSDNIQNTENANQPNDAAKNAGTPITGDNSNMGLWTTLLLITLAGLFVMRKKS